MDISLFDYDLPEELIAQFPARSRDESRLLVLDRDSGSMEILPFRSVTDFLDPGDAIVINDTKVFKARLLGQRATGAEVEIFLVRQSQEADGNACRWEALAQPSRRLKEGERILFANGDQPSLTLRQNRGEGRWLVEFDSESERLAIIEKYGHIPLPQYIRRPDSETDIKRYQTIFARDDKVGAVAAPTAGFHFTEEVLAQLSKKGVKRVDLTLHVGPGTFKPVSVDNIEDHFVDPEIATLPPKAANTLNQTRESRCRVVAVGTTSVRTLESAPIVGDEIKPFSGEVGLYIKPGYSFKVVDRLLTNFHLPKSSLLILVSAFAERELILEAYRRAIAEKFRFYSYGDAMLIL